MPIEERPRPGWATWDAASDSSRPNHYTRSSARSPFPRCELHGINIVDRFPRRCPFGTPNPTATLARLQDIGWAAIGRGQDHEDFSEGLELLDRVDVCLACLDRLLTNRTVRRLRARLGLAA